MKSIQLTAATDENGVLNIQIPMEAPRQKLEVLIVLQPVVNHSDAILDTDVWPEGFFEATAGAFRDDPIQRGEQEEFEDRETIK